jgi:hypothetical protein
VHICLISDAPTAVVADRHGGLVSLRRYVMALARQGHMVHWLISPEVAHTAAGDAIPVPMQGNTVPKICQHVIPCQPSRLEGVHVLCIDQSVWRQRSLHTRLFTFLCLLHRALPCDVLHAWGTLPVTYLTVYTACFLGLPAVVSYSEPCLGAGSQSSFEWRWVAQHLSRALVCSHSDQKRLFATTSLEPAQVWMMNPALPEVGAIMTARYESLRCLKGR